MNTCIYEGHDKAGQAVSKGDSASKPPKMEGKPGCGRSDPVPKGRVST